MLQSKGVAYRGQVIACVVAESLETAREASQPVNIDYDEHPHSAVLRQDDPSLYKPDRPNGNFETDTQRGDFELEFAGAPVKLDLTYHTPAFKKNPMEMHATMANWTGDQLTLYDANQGSTIIREP